MAGKRSEIQRVIDGLEAERDRLADLINRLETARAQKPTRTRKPRQPKAEKPVQP